MRARLVSLLFLIALQPCQTEGTEPAARPLDPNRFDSLPDPITVAGARLPAMDGAPISMLRLFAFRHGHAKAIPFQIDQRDSRDRWVWEVAAPSRRLPDLIAEVERPVDRTRDDQDPVGRPQLDSNDLLVFMAHDLGDPARNAKKALGAKRVVAIEVSHPLSNQTAWAYLALYDRSPPALSPSRYMSYRAGDSTVKSPIYRFSFSDRKVALLKDLTVNGSVLIDRVRIKGEMRLEVGFFRSTLRFTEDDIRGHVAGYIDGPVRTVKQTAAHLLLLVGLPGPSVNCDHFYYPFHAEVPLCLTRRFPVEAASLRLTADYGRAVSRRALGHDPGEEITHDPAPESGHASCWVAFGGDRGSVVSLLQVPETIREYTLATPFILPPEAAEHASTPRVGFTIETRPGFPAGDHLVHGTYVVFPDAYREGASRQAVRLLQHSLKVRIH